jgi:hypothetical protein
VLFISATKEKYRLCKSTVFVFVGHIVRFFSWWIIVLDLTYYFQLKEDCLIEFSPLLGFSRVKSCACVRFYLSTSSTSVHHFEYPFCWLINQILFKALKKLKK